MPKRTLAEKYQIGLYIFILLAVLTIGEYMIGAAGTPWVAVYFAIAIAKAAFVLQNYMHLPELFAPEEVETALEAEEVEA